MNVCWAIPYKTVTFSEEKMTEKNVSKAFHKFKNNIMDCVTSEMHKITIKQEKARIFPFVDLI